MDYISLSWSAALHPLSPATHMQTLEPLMRLMGRQVHMPVCDARHLWAVLSLRMPELYTDVGIAHLLEHMAFKGEQQVTFM